MMPVNQYPVNNDRNSECGSEMLAMLDFSRWYTDWTGGEFYLHVAGPDDTWHRVFCKKGRATGLSMERDGVLRWMVQPKP